MKPIISIETLYFQAQKDEVDTPIMKDVTPYLVRSPGINGKTLAKLLDVKRSALSGAIQLLTGETLNDVLKKWKLLHAMYLLGKTTLSYKDVANLCGYKTINGLSKFMERMIKCTAYEYRESRTHGNRLA